VAPDRTALAAGLGGLALAASAAAARAAVGARVAGGPDHLTVAGLVFAAVSVAGFFLGVLAIWSAVKAWLRDDYLKVRARWGAALGAGAMLLVVALGPCGPPGCPG
jgi:hypothetical protein